MFIFLSFCSKRRSGKSEQRHAAVDAQIDAGDEAARIRREEKRGARQFFGLADAPERDGARHHVDERRPLRGGDAELLEDGRLGRPGTEHVDPNPPRQSEEHTSELQSLMRTSYAVFCLKKKQQNKQTMINEA